MSGTALLGVMLGTCDKANELARICREGSVFEATMINTKPDRVKGDNVRLSQNNGLIPRSARSPIRLWSPRHTGTIRVVG